MKKVTAPKKPKAVSTGAGAHKAVARKTVETHAEVLKRHDAAVKAAATRARDKKLAAARGWSPDGDVALCSARAVAESLRLALGVPVSHDDVLALYWLVADDADAGASILDTLEAAERARGFEPLRLLTRCTEVSAHLAPAATLTMPVILGLELPYGEPHAVVAHNGAWWSWGEPHSPADFPGAAIEEAWSVHW